jgi:hypothetical protein
MCARPKDVSSSVFSKGTKTQVMKLHKTIAPLSQSTAAGNLAKNVFLFSLKNATIFSATLKKKMLQKRFQARHAPRCEERLRGEKPEKCSHRNSINHEKRCFTNEKKRRNNGFEKGKKNFKSTPLAGKTNVQ